MHQVYVGLGSNLNREQNLRRAMTELRACFGDLEVSPVYQTEAGGFDGEDFYNFVVAFNSSENVGTIFSHLHEIEDKQGRDRSKPKFSSRAIDLDLLLFDDQVIDQNGVQVPRKEILYSAFVLRPLCDLAPDLLHPLAGRSYQDLWLKMAPEAGRIEQVRLDL